MNAGDNAIITLKSGDKMEGKVLSAGTDSIEMEYKVTPKIKDRKTVLKADIASVIRQEPSELEFVERMCGRG